MSSQAFGSCAYMPAEKKHGAGRSRSRRCGLGPNPARSAQAPPPLPNEEIWPGAAQGLSSDWHGTHGHSSTKLAISIIWSKKKARKSATCPVQAFRFQCAPRKPVFSNAARPIKKKETKTEQRPPVRERPPAGCPVQGFNALHGLELQLVETRTRQRVDASRGPELVTLATGMSRQLVIAALLAFTQSESDHLLLTTGPPAGTEPVASTDLCSPLVPDLMSSESCGGTTSACRWGTVGVCGCGAGGVSGVTDER